MAHAAFTTWFTSPTQANFVALVVAIANAQGH
jgi:hypothetical protein